SMATLIIPPGKDYKLKLPDGTSVQLNADSKILFPLAFNGVIREVILSGEAYFNVAEDAKRPFIVRLPNSIVQVLGTEFNVNTYNNDKVALVKGAVKLSTANTSVLIKPGYAVSYSNKEGIQTSSFNEEELLAWRQGTYVFHSATIQELCKVVNRWYGINIKYDDITTGQRRFTGYIDRTRPIRQFLDDLEFTGHFNYYFDSDSTLHIR
ncbi:MAG TPA: FecR domain-containing protein, partial [Chitinophaga sp.]|nr:FecR domain-containing protein [Chitinophaga sp.]